MRRLLRYLKGYEKETVLAPLFKMLEACFELLVPLVVAALVDTGIGRGDVPFIWGQFGILVLLAAVGLAASATAQYFAAKSALGYGTALRRDLFHHINTLSYSELDGVGTPTLVTRMTSDVNQLQNGVNMTLRLLLRCPFIVLGALLMSLTISVPMTLWFLGVTALITLVIVLVMRVTVPRYHEAQNTLTRSRCSRGKTMPARAWCGRSPASRMRSTRSPRPTTSSRRCRPRPGASRRCSTRRPM